MEAGDEKGVLGCSQGAEPNKRGSRSSESDDSIQKSVVEMSSSSRAGNNGQEPQEEVAGCSKDMFPGKKSAEASATMSRDSSCSIAASKSTVDFFAEDDDFDDNWLFNPMVVHHMTDVGMEGDDALAAATGVGRAPFKEKRLKDIPCKFYDGISEECWKGRACKYGHEKYTGGIYAKGNPILAHAASSADKVACVTGLEPKLLLGSQAELTGKVVHVVSPSEFYMTFPGLNCLRCHCRMAEEWGKQFARTEEEQNAEKEPTDVLDNYTFGFTGVQLQEGLNVAASVPVQTLSFDELLHNSLSVSHNYRHLQKNDYLPKVELVAVRVNMMWKRGLVLAEFPTRVEDKIRLYRIQLIDTGERVTADTTNICRLPDQFSTSPAKAYKCSLFGISPSLRNWSKAAISSFIDLVNEKDVRIIVKEGLTKDKDRGCRIIEDRPYIVKMFLDSEVNDDEITVDVTRVMIDRGYGIEWHPFPYRPFATSVMNPVDLGFDFLYRRVPPELPQVALEIENSRLACNKHWEEFREYESDDEIYSSNPSEKSRLNFKLKQLEQMQIDHQIVNRRVNEFIEGLSVHDKEPAKKVRSPRRKTI